MEKILKKIISERGGLANIYKSFLEFPQGLSAHYEFYKSIMFESDLPLNRLEREFLAVETSKNNECNYCIKHHEEALNQTTQQDKFESIPSNVKVLYSELAFVLTKYPNKSSPLKEKFLKLGFEIEKYQHAVMVVSYFNFSNRCAFAMGTELEEDFQKTCGDLS